VTQQESRRGGGLAAGLKWGVTLALAAGVCLLLVLLAEFLASASSAGPEARVAEALLLLALLSLPTICGAVAWSVHLRQKRRGAPTFRWLPFAVLASALWAGLVFAVIRGL